MHFVLDMLSHTNPFMIYCGVAIVLLLESCGIPIVNNTLLVVTGALASLGHCSIWQLGIAAVLGSVAGACLAYVVGAHGGWRIEYFLTRWLHIDRQRIVAVERWFSRSGLWMVFISRMTPYVRPFACFPAGMAHTNFPRFFLMALSGSIIWCSAMLALGWHLGRRWQLAVHAMRVYTVPVVGVLLLLGVIYLIVALSIKRRLQGQSEEMEDGEGGGCTAQDSDVAEAMKGRR